MVRTVDHKPRQYSANELLSRADHSTMAVRARFNGMPVEIFRLVLPPHMVRMSMRFGGATSSRDIDDIHKRQFSALRSRRPQNIRVK